MGQGPQCCGCGTSGECCRNPGVSLWTRDKRLRQAVRDVGVLADFV